MIKQITTSKLLNERWANQPVPESNCESFGNKVCFIDPDESYQTILGFGGAFTEAAGRALSVLDSADRDKVVQSLFSESGLNYNMGRTHINSCDFCSNNYHYLPDNAVDLKNFDIAREDKYTVPFILNAKSYCKDLKLLSSPWTPPPHFKTNEMFNFGGKLKPQFKKLWAEYYCEYILAMRSRGIDVEFISVQNEPAAVQTWDSCEYSAEEERDFVVDYLIPALDEYKLDTKIVIWDHNRDIMIERAAAVYADGKARNRVWGTGFHWYAKGFHENLTVHKMLFPEKHLLFTEGCVELNNTAVHDDGNTYIGDWRNGEMYGRNIINDFNNYNEGFIDWNLILNETGGVNHQKNYCESPVMIDTVKKTVQYNPSYYYIGHFSKYVKRGAKRIKTAHNAGSDVFMTAFKNPDGTVAAIIQNEGWIKKVSFLIKDLHKEITLQGRSISTILLG